MLRPRPSVLCPLEGSMKDLGALFGLRGKSMHAPVFCLILLSQINTKCQMESSYAEARTHRICWKAWLVEGILPCVRKVHLLPPSLVPSFGSKRLSCGMPVPSSLGWLKQEACPDRKTLILVLDENASSSQVLALVLALAFL